jgi:hypothetical protein
MTVLNNEDINALPLGYFTSILGTEITGKKPIYIGGYLLEQCVNKRFLITGINCNRSGNKIIGCSLYIEGIDNDFELDTNVIDAFSHFIMPSPSLD